MNKMSLLKETPLLEVIDQPVYPLAKEKLGKAKGIAVPGMPVGSPGMEMGNSIEPYDVLLIPADQQAPTVFAHHGPSPSP